MAHKWIKMSIPKYDEMYQIIWRKKFPSPLGTIYFYVYQQKNGKFGYDAYWANTETGQDKHIVWCKKSDWCDTFLEAQNMVLGLVRDYFDDNPLVNKYYRTVSKLEDYMAGL